MLFIVAIIDINFCMDSTMKQWNINFTNILWLTANGI
jgi:hypothetical protein